MKTVLLAATALITISLCSGARAGTTGLTGGGQPFDNLQPSLAVTEAIPLFGIFPSNGGSGSALGDTLGFVYDFAGDFAPGDSLAAQGQTLPISPNTPLFSLLGTAYGGTGSTTFTLPNLEGRATIGAGTGPGLTPQTLGAATGSPTLTLTTAQIPPHDHSLPGGGVTGTTGGGQPFDNMQPSLPLQPLIAVSGVFPARGGSSGSAAFLGQVASFAGGFIPSGWMQAAGQLLPIATNSALFSILGTTYGGNGTTDFALPDLRGRLSVGADTADPLGARFGQELTTLSLAELPAHDHTLPGGGVTGVTGGGQPVTNDQPSLALNYLIATSGIYPSRGGGAGFDPNIPNSWRDRRVCRQFCAKRMGVRRWPNPPDQLECCAVFDPRHAIWRQWNDRFRIARFAGAHLDRHRAERWRRLPRRRDFRRRSDHAHDGRPAGA